MFITKFRIGLILLGLVAILTTCHRPETVPKNMASSHFVPEREKAGTYPEKQLVESKSPTAGTSTETEKKPVLLCGQLWPKDTAEIEIFCQSDMACSLSPLVQFANLEKFSIADCRNTTKLFPLGELKKLKELKISGVPVADITMLAELPNLETLSLIHTDVEDISALKELVSIQTLDLTNSTKIEDWSPILSLKTLQRLSINIRQLEAAAETLQQMPNLNSLVLNDVRDIGVINVTPFESVTELALYCEHHRYPGPYLSQMDYEKHLDLKNRQLTVVKHFPNLEALKIGAAELRNIKPILNLKHLRKLTIGTYPRSSRDTKLPVRVKLPSGDAFSRLKNLRILGFHALPFSRSYTFLKNMSRLEELDLGLSYIDTIEPLLRLKNLKRLSLRATRIRDISGLENNISLESLDLRDTDVPPNQIFLIQQKRPNLVVIQ